MACIVMAGGLSAAGIATANATQANLHINEHGFGLEGQVTTIGTSSFQMRLRGGVIVTVDTTTGTTYSEGGTSVTSTALHVGESVEVVGTFSPGTTPVTINASAVRIELAKLTGTVVTPGTTSVVIVDPQGFNRTIMLSSTTTYSEGPMKLGTTVTAADLIAGVQIEAKGVVDADHTSLDAMSVKIVLQKIVGTVNTVTGSNISLTTEHGSLTVITSPSTVYFNSSGVATSSIVTTGVELEAIGAFQADGTFLASFVGVGSGHGFPEFPGHHGDPFSFDHHHHHHH